MTSRVAAVELGQDAKQSIRQAIKLVGGIDDLNTPRRAVVIKVGVFDPKSAHHTSVAVADAIINGFNKAPQVFLAESDNYRGTASERLQIWKTLFSERVTPFSLSEDAETRQVKVADERIGLSHILFKPNVFVSTHIMRIYERGSILKNLLGLIPDRKKVRFHKKMEPALLDMCKAIGGIDLAVMDGTHVSLGVAPSSRRVKTNILLVGRDAVAVETLGATLVGMNPDKMTIIQEAVRRGLGEGNIEKIEVLGVPFEDLRQRFEQLLKASEKESKKKPPKTTKKR